MSGCWTVVGVLLTIAMVILSALINFSFGYSLGTTEMNGRVFGAVSVVAVGVMAVLPLRISKHCGEGSRTTAIVGTVVFGILMAYTIAGHASARGAFFGEVGAYTRWLSAVKGYVGIAFEPTKADE